MALSEHPPLPTGLPAVDRYLAEGYARVPGMSSRFAAAVAARLLDIQHGLGVAGGVAEIGTFEGRFFIALALALRPSEKAVGIDTFDWPTPEVQDRFHANCRAWGVPESARETLVADSRSLRPGTVTAAAGGPVRLFHVDGEHSRLALTRDLDLARDSIADGGLIVLDDMLHPGYPTLMVAVQAWLEANPEMTVLAVIDRETLVAATKFVLCRKSWFKRYEERMLEAFRDNIWPMGADFEPHWCLVLALDTRLADLG
jgi:predicted O-methyltransferase YrrM